MPAIDTANIAWLSNGNARSIGSLRMAVIQPSSLVATLTHAHVGFAILRNISMPYCNQGLWPIVLARIVK